MNDFHYFELFFFLFFFFWSSELDDFDESEELEELEDELVDESESEESESESDDDDDDDEDDDDDDDEEEEEESESLELCFFLSRFCDLSLCNTIFLKFSDCCSCFSCLTLLFSMDVRESLWTYFLLPLHSYVQWPSSRHFWHRTLSVDSFGLEFNNPPAPTGIVSEYLVEQLRKNSRRSFCLTVPVLIFKADSDELWCGPFTGIMWLVTGVALFQV